MTNRELEERTEQWIIERNAYFKPHACDTNKFILLRKDKRYAKTCYRLYHALRELEDLVTDDFLNRCSPEEVQTVSKMFAFLNNVKEDLVV